MDWTPFEALKKSTDPLEFWRNSDPKCPHCAHVCRIDRHEWYELYNDDDIHTVTCPECDRDFDVETVTSHSFTTQHQERME